MDGEGGSARGIFSEAIGHWRAVRTSISPIFRFGTFSLGLSLFGPFSRRRFLKGELLRSFPLSQAEANIRGCCGGIEFLIKMKNTSVMPKKQKARIPVSPSPHGEKTMIVGLDAGMFIFLFC